jgi:hypothetical protein
MFYGNLSNEIMNLELQLQNLPSQKLSNIKFSMFRLAIVSHAKNTFEQFFDVEKRKEECVSQEKKIIWEEKLFGNMEFVGELFK